MNKLYHSHCDCRDNRYELTELGIYHKLLEEFKSESDENITKFFEKYNINRMCCRMTLFSPYHVLYVNDSPSDYFKTNNHDTFAQQLTMDLSHLNVVPNLELEFAQ